MKKWVKRFAPIGIVIAVITSFVFTGIASQKAPSIPSTAEKALVARVIDGDTIQLDDGRKVRLIGVDTPETVHPQKEVEYYGKEASDFTKSMLEGKEVYLEYDIQPTDKYGRTLAYIWLSDGTLFNELLVLKGFAQVATFPPNVKGVHQVELMGDLVKALVEQGVDDQEIAAKLGMELEEVYRLKQITGIAELFKNQEYSRAWEIIEEEDDDAV